MNDHDLSDAVRETRRVVMMAHGLLAAAIVGTIAVVALWPASVEPTWREIALHGLEGALVGGICDWFAIAKTYKAIEDQAAAVATGIGAWVGHQLLAGHAVRAMLHEALDDSDLRKQVYDAVDQAIGAPEDAEALVARAWVRIEGTLAATLAEQDFTKVNLPAGGELLDDDDVRDAIQTCSRRALGAVASDSEFGSKFNAALPNGPKGWAVMALTPLDRVAKWAEAEPSGAEPVDPALAELVATALRVATREYTASWQGLSAAHRLRAATALVRSLREPISSHLGKFLCAERDRLRSLDRLNEHPLAARISEVAERVLNKRFSAGVAALVTGSLNNLSGRGLRAMVEEQTGRYLHMIRISGTALGLVVGGVIGGVLALVG
ncbi:hypothetical protein LBMAG42_19910 [Deltaproteobacteria bacterium]|nr:hypothetical protein LBMAG42_19910 [Deltaproteobacteria bacterium]